MRRPAIMLALLAMLGLATSLAVAWMGALVDRSAWPDVPLTKGPTGERTELRGWLIETGRDATLTWRTFESLDLSDDPPELGRPTRLAAWSVGHRLPDQPGPFAPARERTRDVAWEVSAGWPMRCVRAERGPGPAEFALPGEFVRGGLAAMAFEWPIPHGGVANKAVPDICPWPYRGMAAVIPLRPMPVALLANTLVFALAWSIALGPLMLWRPWRHARRRRRTACVWCAHDVRGLPNASPCPECGRNPRGRASVRDIALSPLPAAGAVIALLLMLAAPAALLCHRWTAIDRLPPLHHAAAVGDVEAIERLIAAGVDVNDRATILYERSRETRTVTALHFAAARGSLDAVERLLGLGAHAWGVNAFETPLQEAVLGQHERVAVVLLHASSGGGTGWPQGEDIERTCLPIARAILALSTPSPRDLFHSAWDALAAHDIAMLDLIIESGLDVRQHDGGQIYAHAMLLDTMAWHWSPPHDSGLTRALLERGVPGERPGYGVEAARAVNNGCLPCLEALIDHGVAPPIDMMYECVRAGDVGVLRAMIDAGGSPDMPDGFGRTPLWYAAMALNPDMVATLLEAGADPTCTVGGLTITQALTAGKTAFLGAFGEPTPEERAARPDDVARISDLLEAAEARWAQRDARTGSN